MTHHDPHDNPDDLLERSLHAMRSAPIPDGPSEELLADTRSALLRAEFQDHQQRPPTLLRRILTMKSLTRIAASLLVVSAVAVAVVLFAASSVTWAQVIEKVANAKTLSFTAVSTAPNVPKPITMKFLMTNDGRCRITMGENVTVKNDKTGEVLVLEPQHKIATVVNMGPNKSYGFGAADPFEAFKQLKGKDAANLGEKEIDGHKCKGFTSNDKGTEFVVWADKSTGDPIRIELSAPTIDGGKTFMVMSDFAVNPTIDEKLFDTTIPEGYKRIQIPANIAKSLADTKGEDHLIGALRGYAQRKDGRFPKRLDDWAAFASLVNPKTAKMDPKDLEFMTHVGAIAGWAFTLPKDQWAYLGDGVTLGENGKIVFWYQDPESKKYRAIYGDLTAKDIDPKDVPRKTEK